MKKLMTMLAAVATAFGLFADPVNYGTSFEGLAAGTSIFDAETEGENWEESADPNATALVADYGQEGKVTGNARPAFFSGSTQNQYLNVKTALGSPIARKLDTAWDLGDGNFYSDTLVKFTNFEDAPTTIDGKIAVWVQEIENDNDGTITTNLMVTAGSTLTGTRKDYLVQSNWEPSADQGGWTRVTIKAIPSIVNDDTMPGFAIWIDQNPVLSLVSKADIDALELSLTDIAKNYNKEGNLFLSMVQSGGAVSTINAVAFDGQGQIDDVLLTDVAPSFAGDPQFFFITAGDANVESITVDNEPYTFGDPLVLTANPQTFTVVPTYADGFIDGVWTATGDTDVDMANHQFTVYAGGETGTIVSKAALVQIGDKYYSSLAEALADTTQLAKEGGLVELAGALTIDSTVTIPTVDGVDAVVLDLAGNTITYEGDNAAILANGPLMVIDSSEAKDGKIDAEKAICANAALTINAGIIKGEINFNDASINGGAFTLDNIIWSELDGSVFTISDGTFDDDVGEEFYFTEQVVDGKKAAYNTDAKYWEIVEDTSVDFTVTAGANSKVAQVLVNGDDVTLDPPAKLEAKDTYKVTFEANSGYMFAAGAQYVFEGTAADEAIDITGPDAVLVVATVTDADGAAMGDYATLTEALTAATNLCTVTLQQNATTDFFKNGPFAANQYPDGLTIDLNEKVWTVDLKSDNKYALQLSSGNKFTFKNGDLKVADNEWATLTTMFQNYADLTVEDVDIDATNLKGANGYWDYAAVFAVMNGNVQITGSTSVTGTDGYLLSVGNHAGEYQSRAVTINTTGALAGDFLFAGGAVTYVNGTLDTDAAYYYGSATNAPSSTTGYPGGATIFAITDLTGFNLTTGVGEVPVAPTTVSTYKRCGQLYADVATAKAAAQTSDDIVLFTDYALAADETFANAVAVVAPAKITLGTYKLTTPNGDLADEAFVIPDDKKIKKTDNTGSFTYELENAADPIDPTKPAESYATKGEADARVEAINANKATMITVPTDMATVKDSYIANVAAKAVLNGSTDMYDVIVDVIESKDVKDNLAAAEATIAAALGDVAADDAKVTITAIPGLYYSALEGGTLELSDETDRVPATGDTVTIDLDHYEGAGFYQIKVSAAPAK